jgi:hypothetical protein
MYSHSGGRTEPAIALSGNAAVHAALKRHVAVLRGLNQHERLFAGYVVAHVLPLAGRKGGGGSVQIQCSDPLHSTLRAALAR